MSCSKLPLFMAYLAEHVPPESPLNRCKKGPLHKKRKPSSAPRKRQATLPPFVRKVYPEGIYRGILKEKGMII